jgi:hypothetical protein
MLVDCWPWVKCMWLTEFLHVFFTTNFLFFPSFFFLSFHSTEKFINMQIVIYFCNLCFLSLLKLFYLNVHFNIIYFRWSSLLSWVCAGCRTAWLNLTSSCRHVQSRHLINVPNHAKLFARLVVFLHYFCCCFTAGFSSKSTDTDKFISLILSSIVFH